MYHAFYGLLQAPFDPVADASFLVETAGQRGVRDAIADLVRRRLAVITLEGWPGAGKTELLRAYERSIDPDRVRTRWITRPDFDKAALVEILGEMLAGPFGAPPSFQEVKGLLTARANAGQATVLLVDDAESLTSEALQALGAFTDLAKDELSLLSVVLVVRPPFVELFSRPAAAALDRRASVRVRLPPLTPVEARSLVEHRLRQAGAAEPHRVLSPEAIEAIVVEAGGIPRRLLSLGDRVLQAGFARRRMPVDYATAEASIRGGGGGGGGGGGARTPGASSLASAPAPARARLPISVEGRGFGAAPAAIPRRIAPRRIGDVIAGMAVPTMLLIVAVGLGYWLWAQSDEAPPPRSTDASAALAAGSAPASPSISAPLPAPPTPAVAANAPPRSAVASAAPLRAPAPNPPAQIPLQTAVAPPPTAVNVLFIPARRGDTLRSLYRVVYRAPRYRPSFDELLAANPDVTADQRLANGQLVALPGPLIDR
jgi:type II secretory pathway predicted ATPase ExeA